MSASDSISGIHLDLEKTFGAMAECVVIARPDRRIIFLNRAAEEMYGYTRQELIGQTAEHIYVNIEDYRSAGELHAASAKAGDSERYAVDFRRKNGSIFTCEVVSTPLYDAMSEHVGFMIIGRDISDRLALEAMAEEASATLEEAIEAISEGFALYDKDDRLVICNQNYRRIYPESADAMVGGASFEEILRYGLDNAQYDTGYMTDEQWLNVRLERHQKADGATIEQKLGNGRWLRISERRTSYGGIAGIRADITELKNAQNELREAYANITILTDSLSSVIIEIDLNGTCKFINELGSQWFSSTQEELVGTRIADQLAQQILDDTETVYQSALDGVRGSCETCGVYPDGIRRDVLMEFIPKINEIGDVNGLIIFSTDITGRKKVETTLAELYSVTSTRELGSEQKIQQILRIGCEHFDLPFGIISRIVEESYTINWAESPNGEIEAGATFSLGDTYCFHTLKASKPVAIAHTAKSELAQHPCYQNFALEAYIGAPLLVDGECYGTINFTSPDPHKRTFSKTDTEIIRQFADWIGNEIARQQDHQALMDAKVRLERIASIDDLTNIFNRRAFMERADTEIARYRRTKNTFTVALLDIDHFKSINDTYGHATGDDVLKRFSEIIGTALRAVDVFGRVGGEEFCILLDSTGPEDALMVCERLREKIEAGCSLPHMTGKVTCSMGLATVQKEDIEFSALMQRADIALYEAKETGRNRCCLFKPELERAVG
ncbi:diguanylate cyclase [Roseibium sp.]|uniref:sensor domain-containing diguanylate cyclase n=1 Tax=Roseibium sp. TaxID=1936156 RepID=UPI003A97EC2C